MNLEIKALHFSLNEDSRGYIEKKLVRLHEVDANIIDLIITITSDAGFFVSEAVINFRWGVSAHVKEREADIRTSVDRLFDAVFTKVVKEKEKAHKKR